MHALRRQRDDPIDEQLEQLHCSVTLISHTDQSHRSDQFACVCMASSMRAAHSHVKEQLDLLGASHSCSPMRPHLVRHHAVALMCCYYSTMIPYTSSWIFQGPMWQPDGFYGGCEYPCQVLAYFGVQGSRVYGVQVAAARLLQRM